MHVFTFQKNMWSWIYNLQTNLIQQLTLHSLNSVVITESKTIFKMSSGYF